MRKLVWVCFLLFLASCSQVQQSTEAYQNAPKYRFEYRPFSGEIDSANYNQALAICDSKESLYRVQIESSQNSGDNTSYSCKANSSDTLRCTPDSKSNVPAYGGTTWNKNYNERNRLANIFHKGCMAERGFDLVSVCFKNCI